MVTSNVFTWPDYLVFGLLLILSSCIGIFIMCRGKRRKSTKEIFLGNREITLVPVTFSIIASFMSAISILGTTAEVYNAGLQYGMISLSYMIAYPLAAEVYMPMFYHLNLTSAHEYLSLRFHSSVRWVVSIAFIVQMILYISVVLYAPALAFSQVSGLDMWITILSTGLVCTFYTAIGGMKAVIYTDLFQMILMFVGFIAVIALGTFKVGGIDRVWAIAEEGGRINFINWDPNPLERHTIWTLICGGAGLVSSIYATNQAQVQRYLSCKNFKTARIALWLNVPLTAMFLYIMVSGGLVIYAYYAGCDPYLSGIVTKRDQVFPLFIMEVFSKLPGIPGLFLSSIFAAALSSVSSGINSLATVLMVDVIVPAHSHFKGKKFKEETASLMSTLLEGDETLLPGWIGLSYILCIAAIFLGLLTIGLAFACSVVAPTVLQIALSIFGMLGGPILSVFTLGIFFPCINWKGALGGLLASLLGTLWVGLGSIFNPATGKSKLSFSNDNCTVDNNTMTTMAAGTTPPWTTAYNLSTTSPVPTSSPPSFYQLSYLYYTLFAMLIALVVSFLISLCTGWNTDTPVRSNYINPGMIRLYNCSCFKCLPCQTMEAKIPEPTQHTDLTGETKDETKKSEKMDSKANSKIISEDELTTTRL